MHILAPSCHPTIQDHYDSGECIGCDQPTPMFKIEQQELKPYDMPKSSLIFDTSYRYPRRVSMSLEKLGVQVDDSKTKTASEKKTCPECGAELLKDSNVPQCPNCGTRPWESEPKEKK